MQGFCSLIESSFLMFLHKYFNFHSMWRFTSLAPHTDGVAALRCSLLGSKYYNNYVAFSVSMYNLLSKIYSHAPHEFSY